MKLKNRSFIEFIYAVLYKISLDYMYLNYQVSLFGYSGFYDEGGGMRTLLGWGIYLFLYISIRTENNDTSSLFTYIIFYISISPFITLYQYNSYCSFWMLISQVICLLMINYLLFLGRKLRFKRAGLLGINYSNQNLRMFILVLLGIFLAMLLARFGIPSFRSLWFEEASSTRAAVSLSTLQSIIQNYVCKIIIPVSMLVMLREKKWVLFTLLMFIQIYTYAVTGFKTYFFIPLVLICLSLFPKLNLQKTIIIGLPIMTIGTMLAYEITNNIWIYGVLGNRLLFFPARIKYAYFDYFSNNSFAFFSQSTIAKLINIESIYEINIRNLIGELYFDKPNMWTNTGFMADAYANFGFLGMALMGTILALVLNIIVDKLYCVSADLQKGLQAVFVLFFISLNDGATISVLFSGGLLFAVLLVCIIKFNTNANYSQSGVRNIVNASEER